MAEKHNEWKKSELKNAEKFFDNNVLKIIIFASLVIVISVFAMGGLSYFIAKNETVEKLKSKDLVYITESISSKIDGRIERAKETSLVLARDPTIKKWVEGGETDEELGEYAKEKITQVSQNYDYDNSFIVSNVTNHYWAEGGELIDTMTKSDPDDSWFFDTISAGKLIDIQIDYNKERNDTFVFVDALMGDLEDPLAVTGVGLNIKDIAQEFKEYEFSENTGLWLVNEEGHIFISSDVEEIGEDLSNFVPSNILKDNLSGKIEGNSNSNVIDYQDSEGETYDLIFQPLESTDWDLVFQIPRSESLSIISAIKTNTIIGSVLVIIFIILLFYLISRKIADPYKRAMALSQELEKQVKERTEELQDKNEKIEESIKYARLIQQSVLPTTKEINEVFADFFALWLPKDIVGGDFYWLKKVKGNYVMVVGDCTGHGVPGALMTMAVNSMLDNIVNENCCTSPSEILKKLHRQFKNKINDNNSRAMDEGLTAGVICISNTKANFAGAKIDLNIRTENELYVIKGDRKTIGYSKTDNHDFTVNELSSKANNVYYLTTDGYLDQNGGDKNHCFGKKRFYSLIEEYYSKPLQEQKKFFVEALNEYMQDKAQRDDVTVIGFKIREK